MAESVCRLSDAERNTVAGCQRRRSAGASTVAMVTVAMTLLVWYDVTACVTASSLFPAGACMCTVEYWEILSND